MGGSNQIVYIVEDEPDVCASLIFKLEACGYRAKAYETGEAFLAALAMDASGCAVIDVHLPGMSGLAVLEALAKNGSRLAVVVVTGKSDVAMAVRAMRSGASDFIEKPFPRGAVELAVRRAFEALAETGHDRMLRREAAAAFARIDSLTRREREVFDGLSSGKLSKQVAIDLGISPRTVEVHRARIMKKTGAGTLSELLRFGILCEIHQKWQSENGLRAVIPLHKGKP